MTIYAVAADFRLYLPQVEEGNADDALIQDVLERATALVASELKLPFLDADADWPAATAKTVFSEDSQWLKLPAYKQGSITSITQSGASTALTSTSWEESWDNGIFYLWRESGWAGLRYTVTAVWGYGPVPPEIVEITLECAVNIWRMRDRGMFQEIQPGPTSGGQLRFIGGLTSQQKSVITNVRSSYRDGVY